MVLSRREWDILHWISAEKPIEELDPPLTKEEESFYKRHKAEYDSIVPHLPDGVHFMWTPAYD